MQPDLNNLKPVNNQLGQSDTSKLNPSQPDFSKLAPVDTTGGTSGVFGTTQDSGGLLKNPITSLQNIGNNAVNNTGKEFSSAFNISNTSFADYAQEQNNANDFGVTGITPNDFDSNFLSNAASQIGKGVMNIGVGTVSMLGNIGSFLWNANVHPLKTLERVASDPVGFVSGLIPDSLKQVLGGTLSAGKDAFNGDWSKAGSDLGSGAQRAWTAFLDNPVQEVLKYYLVGDLLEAPAILGGEMGAEDAASAGGKSLKNVPANTANMVKSIYKPYSAAWDIAKTGAKNISEEGVSAGLKTTTQGILSDVSKTLKNTYSAVKTSGQMFTQGGRSMILATQAKTAFDLTRSNMDIKDYESQLQGLDANSERAKTLQIKLDQANMEKQTAEQNFFGLQYTMANALNKMLGQKYNDTSSITSDLENNLSGTSIQKDSSYKNSLNKPDNTPININDVGNFTNTLRQRADVLGQNSANGADSADLRSFADGLDLRQQISSAGGLKSYIESEVQKQFKETQNVGNASVKNSSVLDEFNKNELRKQVTQEIMSKIKDTGFDLKSFEKPLTAQNLQQIWSSYIRGNRLGESSSRSHFINGEDTSGQSADSAYQGVMSENLNRDNPNGYKDFKNGEQQYKNLLQMKIFKNEDGSPKTFMNVNDFLNFATKNWDVIQKLDPQTRIRIQQSLASKILTDAIDNSTKMVNTEKLGEDLNKYKNYLSDIPQIKQILTESTLDLSKLAENNPELQSQVAELYGKNPEQIKTNQANIPVKENEISQTEEQLKQAEQAKKTVGIDPQEIISKIKNLKSVKDFNDFIANSAEKDPVKIGQLVKQDAFERNNPDPENLDVNNVLATYEELNNLFNNASPKMKSKFFPDKSEIEDPLKTYKDLVELQKTVPKTSTSMGKILQGVLTGITFALGWHFQTIRFGAHLIESPTVKNSETALTEDDFNKIINDPKIPSKTKTLFGKLKDDYLFLLISQGYKNTKELQ